MNVVRLEALGAVLAGIAWLASFVVGLGVLGAIPEVPGLSSPNVIEGIFGVALLGTLVGLVAVHTRQSRSYGTLGLLGFVAAFLGTALLLANVAFVRVAGRGLLDLILGVGIVGALVGFVLLGVATLRAKVLPDWCGVALIFAPLAAGALGDYGGGAVLGLLWLAVGFALMSGRVGNFGANPY